MATTSRVKTVIPKCNQKSTDRAVKRALEKVDIAVKQIAIALMAADDAAEALTTAMQAAYDAKNESLGNQLNKRACEWEDFAGQVEDMIP